MQNFADELRILNVTSDGTAQTLRALVDTRLATKSGGAAKLPTDNKLIQIALTASAEIGVQDALSGDSLTVAADTRTSFPLADLSGLKIINAATVSVELYYA